MSQGCENGVRQQNSVIISIRRDPPDHVGEALGEPEVAIGAERDAVRATLCVWERELPQFAGRLHPSDHTTVGLGEPDVPVRASDDRVRAAFRDRKRELRDRPRGSRLGRGSRGCHERQRERDDHQSRDGPEPEHGGPTFPSGTRPESTARSARIPRRATGRERARPGFEPRGAAGPSRRHRRRERLPCRAARERCGSARPPSTSPSSPSRRLPS